MRNLYETAAGSAVQIKRILTGMYGQTRYTKYLESIQYLPREDLKKLQAIRMSAMLKHAVENVPFYKDLNGNLELSPDTIFEDIKNFPIITRKIIAEQTDLLIDPNTPYLRKLKSGGTTSKRINVLRDKTSLTDRNDEYFNRILGIYPGMTRLVLNRHETHYYADREKEVEFEENKISRTFLVNPTYFGEEKLKKAYQILMKRKPKIIRANSTFVYEFAKAIESNGWETRHVPIIEGCCVTMQPHYITTLERVFGSTVYDVYGATEVNAVSCQCEQRGGMHYVPVSHFLEIMKNNGEEALDGETGELIITSLSHKAMPIIRYQIGDYATFTDDMCGCGRTLPMLKRIDGRVIETIRSPVGTHMTVHEISELLQKLKRTVDFQAIQLSQDSIALKLDANSGKLDAMEEKYIKNRFNEILGYSMNMSIEYVNEIKKQPNGKTLRVLSRLEQ